MMNETTNLLNWRATRMRLSKDGTCLIYNDFLTLAGISLETYNYKQGNRSALHWIIDRYQVKKDQRSGIVNDPNRLDEEQYIGQVIRVSVETVKVVRALPMLGV